MPKCDVKTRYLPATFAWTALLSTTTLFFCFPCQYYVFRWGTWVPALQGVITFFVLANFTLATFMDPGVIPKAPPDEDREDDFHAPLYKNVEINGITVRMKWCVTCKFYRPPRCSHCSVCNHCIETFDHHCPWVNNCIGRRNYRFFFFFLLSLSFHMLSIFGLCLYFVLERKQQLGEVDTIVALVLMGVVILLFIPIFGLTGFHVVLVSRGRTTNEQVTGKFNGGYNPFSHGCLHNCCYTQFGPQYPSLIKPEKYSGKRRGVSTSEISTIGSENQVKTYMDSSNGVRNASSNAYNKLSPGRDGSDTDMEPTASQSADCEPTPPVQRHGSKSNFFLPPVENSESPRHPPPSQHRHPMHHTRGSPHPRPRGMNGSRSHTPDPLSPEASGSPATASQRSQGQGGASPTTQRIKAIGVPTPLAISSPIRRSNPGTPTQVRRPDFIGVNDAPTYYDVQQGNNTGIGAASGAVVTGYSPQRRFLSESELVRQGTDHSYSRTNNTVDNIRELAGSPQRGVYMWKDNSPGSYPVPSGTTNATTHQSPSQRPPPSYDYYRSNPTSPTQQLYANAPRAAYHPAMRGGVPVFPPHQSPQVKRKATMATPTTPTSSDTRRRPMSFVRALEMTDSMEMVSAPNDNRSQRPTTPTPDRASVYDMTELAMWWETSNCLYGTTKNPYNTRHIVGGSSGGEGCIQAAAGSPLGIGSDIGGSIRIPSYFNGIFGHKPSTGIVSNDGQYPSAQSEDQKRLLAIGPMCRYAQDLSPILKILADKNADILRLNEKVDISKLKFYYMEDDGGQLLTSPVELEIKEAMRKVIRYLEKAYKVKVTKLNIRKLKKSTALWMANMSCKDEKDFTYELSNRNGHINLWWEFLKWTMFMSNHTLIALLTATFERFAVKHGSDQHTKLIQESRELYREFQDILGEDGVFLFPTHPTAAPLHHEPLVKAFNFSYTAIINVLGLPATACPLGLNKQGLPIGIQIVGGLHQDRLTIAVAEELERGFGGWVPPVIVA